MENKVSLVTSIKVEVPFGFPVRVIVKEELDVLICCRWLRSLAASICLKMQREVLHQQFSVQKF